MPTRPRPDFLEPGVADVDAARSFYTAAFGWEMTGFGPSYCCTMTSDVALGLQADPAERPAAPRIAIRVDALEAAFEQAQAAGGVITRPIFAFSGRRLFHFRDPDDNELAVYEPA